MRIHKIVQQAATEGRQVLIAGKPDHPEVIGIVSRRDVRAIVNRRGKESIRAIMTPSPITADESFTMEDALETTRTTA